MKGELTMFSKVIIRRRCRAWRGSSIVEFAASLTVFICFFLIPAISLLSMPARYMIADSLIRGAANRLSVALTRKDAFAKMKNDRSWQIMAAKFGVQMRNPQLALIISGENGNSKLVVRDANTEIPREWLPNGNNKPAVYSVELSAQGDVAIPGIYRPISMNFKGRSHWENLSRNPATGRFYINE
jgi:hypothetical protein